MGTAARRARWVDSVGSVGWVGGEADRTEEILVESEDTAGTLDYTETRGVGVVGKGVAETGRRRHISPTLAESLAPPSRTSGTRPA